MTPDQGLDPIANRFGELLRTRRKSAGLTQADLAERAGVGVRTVRDLERGRSVRPQRTTVELLVAALGLTGLDRSEFVAAARRTVVPAADPTGAELVTSGSVPVTPPTATEPTATRSADGAPGLGTRGRGLPPPDELVGRDREVAELAGLLAGRQGPVPALVSLVGLAGVGKTGLALAVADRVTDRYPGGVVGVVITEVSTASDVISAVAIVFGVGRPADLARRLADQPSLLLIDAVERAPAAVAEAVYRLTVTAPQLRVLATGRQPVGLAGERVVPVTPLEVPPADLATELAAELAGTGAVDPAALNRYPAVALFLTRLRQVRREPLQADEAVALVALVRRLGGLPLAIELAAARGRLLDLTEILDRYGNRVLDLARPRTTDAVGSSLRDAVAASYRLLEHHERVALRRLSVFRNRWSLELAEAMLDDESVLDPRLREMDPVILLDRFLALGLISARGTGPFRFRLLDVVRDFAQERAAANGDLTAIRRRHAVVFAGLATRIAPELAGANLLGAVNRLDEVASDLWAALAHSANDEPPTALRLAASLARWWRFRGRDVAGRQWLRRLLGDPRTVDVDPEVRAWAQLGLAQLAQEHGAGPQELPRALSALVAFHRVGNVTGELAARHVLCGLFIAVGGYDEARRHGEAVLALAGATGRIRDMAVAQNNLTWHEVRAGDLRAARRRLVMVDRLAAQCGEDRLRMLARANLAEIARLDGRYADAVEQGRRVLPALSELGDPGHRFRLLGTIGLALAEEGRLGEAGQVLAELRDTRVPRDELVPGDMDLVGGSLINELCVPREEGLRALIEATIALRQGDREWAAEWYVAAAQAYAGCRDLRVTVEALVGLVVSSDDPAVRARALERIDQVCRRGAITLLPRERALLGSVGASLPSGGLPGPRRSNLARLLAGGASEESPEESPLDPRSRHIPKAPRLVEH
jgi:predicted ATPase/DNA-binding XRE family transcriptional regulator